MNLSTFVTELFTWWNGNTIGTRVHTWRHGEFVGDDQFGNKYYRTKGGAIDPALGFERRWVIFNGYAEATAIPPGWHAWMHQRSDVPPSKEDYKAYEWEKPHRPNPTGTIEAYRPPGSTLGFGHRPAVTGDYRAWTPE
ncbi:NADH:ubiquinone oxidoreductase subunit NDUFA12 [Ancylobacter sonchi]|uniref:NADH:ubiquinone oxidoreductase subunit NDUFA12 n=1 Tax=Ancylobacter sonchi TaxID=1937790 RepID=UPI001BD5D45C|nr:NADH:ubiquinone oxidoreductase subunit NDUFA12 [Ancylobacter sonchi]MBS7536345.1 NADH:ubiquinone oxidoreductase subunit NDUFA12 [Ancylobacter sonchi]